MSDVLQLLLAQQEVLNAIRQELSGLRKEVAELRAAKVRVKADIVSTVAPKTAMSSREMSKMMFVSWASRQPVAFEGEAAEERQRRLLPEFESANNCRVLNVDRLR